MQRVSAEMHCMSCLLLRLCLISCCSPRPMTLNPHRPFCCRPGPQKALPLTPNPLGPNDTSGNDLDEVRNVPTTTTCCVNHAFVDHCAQKGVMSLFLGNAPRDGPELVLLASRQRTADPIRAA